MILHYAAMPLKNRNSNNVKILRFGLSVFPAGCKTSSDKGTDVVNHGGEPQ